MSKTNPTTPIGLTDEEKFEHCMHFAAYHVNKLNVPIQFRKEVTHDTAVSLFIKAWDVWDPNIEGALPWDGWMHVCAARNAIYFSKRMMRQTHFDTALPLEDWIEMPIRKHPIELDERVIAVMDSLHPAERWIVLNFDGEHHVTRECTAWLRRFGVTARDIDLLRDRLYRICNRIQRDGKRMTFAKRSDRVKRRLDELWNSIQSTLANDSGELGVIPLDGTPSVSD